MHAILKEFSVDPSSVMTLGSELVRPECVLTEKDGTVWSADSRGSLTWISSDGEQSFVQQHIGGNAIEGNMPNGLAMTAEGNFVIANMGTRRLELMTPAFSATKSTEAL